jgi:hypothetical protein
MLLTPSTSASHKIPAGSFEHISYIVAVIRVSAQYGSHAWSTLLIPVNGGNYSGESTAGMPQRDDDWPLTRLPQHLVKTGGRLVKHAR